MSGASVAAEGSYEGGVQVVIENLDRFGGKPFTVFVVGDGQSVGMVGNQLPQCSSPSLVVKREERENFLHGRQANKMPERRGLLTPRLAR